MTTTLDQLIEPHPDVTSPKPRRKTVSIIVATDGSSTAEPAFRTAQLLSTERDAEIHVISVLELLPVVTPLPQMMIMNELDMSSRSDAQRTLVHEQVAKFDPEKRWSFEMRIGRPAEVISRVASARNADLIIMGMNKHGLWDRFLGEETAMEIARLTEVPLLIAGPDTKRLPRRVAVAMDLRPEGLRPLARVVSLLGEKLSLTSVHVKPRSEFLGIDWADFDREYELAMNERFHDLEKQLSAVGSRAELVVLHGDPARELIDFVKFSKAELLIVGINRRAGRSRAIGGRMAARLVRRCDCNLLILPSMASVSLAQAGDATQTLYDAAQWESALRRFSSRNGGRRVVVEVNDPKLGAFVQIESYPLLGVDYDHRDSRVEIMLGDFHGGEKHLTRSIVKPESVSVRTVNGSDVALSVAHNGGQTLLTFVNPET